MMFITPIPPTTSEIVAIPIRSIDSAPKIASCIWRNSAWLRTRKSSSSLSPMWWRSRRIASACRFARSVVSSLVALIRIACVLPRCVTRMCDRIVVIGMRTTSSWLCPKGDGPFSSSTPSTRYGCRPMRTVRPTGSEDPKSSRAVSEPMTITFSPSASLVVVHTSPRCTFQLRMSK